LIVVVNTINTIFLTIIQYYTQKHDFFKYTIQRLELMSKVIGESNVGAIIFNDQKSAESYLFSFKVDESIENATIRLPDSSILAKYSKLNKPQYKDFKQSLNKRSLIISEDLIVVNCPIFFQNEFVASLSLDYSLAEYKQKQKQFIYWSILIILSSIVVATILAFFFQKVITRPIYQLEQVIDRISTESNYSIRSANKGTDEIGKLSKGFNLMITRIENQNNDLKNAKAKSDEALEAKERFLANITHELRTPLSSIIGLTSLIEETELTKEQAGYFKNIKNSSDHLLSIINDLLEFSKLGSGRFQFEKKEFSIRHTIARIEGTLEFEIKNRNLIFQTNVDEGVPSTMVGDEFRLNQILINLIGNAIKFTPQGIIQVNITKKEEDDKSINIEFCIKDTGIGISKDKLVDIFESFTQESSSTNRKYGGSGLGLTITKQLIELQQGRIWVESEKGKGSSFFFFIPFDKKLVKVGDMGLCLKNLKIMVIDDNVINLELTKSILEKSNSEVYTFQDGLIALEKLRTDNFDIVLLDLHMPGTDGFEISKMIRNIEDNKINNIPILALTAAATNTEIQKCFDTGMNDYIVKPFNKDELITKLLTLCPK